MRAHSYLIPFTAKEHENKGTYDAHVGGCFCSEHNFLLCGALVDSLVLRGDGVSGQGTRVHTLRMVLNSRAYAAILECAFCITSPPLSS